MDAKEKIDPVEYKRWEVKRAIQELRDELKVSKTRDIRDRMFKIERIVLDGPQEKQLVETVDFWELLARLLRGWELGWDMYIVSDREYDQYDLEEAGLA